MRATFIPYCVQSDKGDYVMCPMTDKKTCKCDSCGHLRQFVEGGVRCTYQAVGDGVVCGTQVIGGEIYAPQRENEMWNNANYGLLFNQDTNH